MSLRQLKNSAIKISTYFQKNILQTRIYDGGTIRNIAAELGVSTSTVLRTGLFSRI
jgi:DNA-binding MurR/RpiR family transcriptional regulator